MDSLQRCSAIPASRCPYITPGFELRELHFVAKMRVQVLRRRGDTAAVESSAQLPTVPNTTSGIDPVALWIGPDDWLVYSLGLDEMALSACVAGIDSNVPLVATTVSSASVVLELRGPGAIDVLMRDCSLDLEGGAISPGSCARTVFAQSHVLIHRPQDAGSWRLFIERPVSAYVWDWLLGAASD